MGLTYRDSGVDLDVYAQAMQKLPHWIEKTRTSRVMPLTGGFAGLFRLMGEGVTYRDPVLVSGTDGVGTKLKIASMLQKYDTVGIDLVAMCVNDCLCIGAEPLFFLDYIALPSDDPIRLEQLVKGVSEGCVQGGMALLGGETAIMPAVYAQTEFDMAGFAVGVVERDQIIDGTQITPGDVVLGIPSNGLHSNGFSLVRKIVFDHAGLSADQPAEFTEGSLGEALLTPTRIYASEVQALMRNDAVCSAVHGIVHVTGGGLEENIVRILPDGVVVEIDSNAWTPHPVFGWLQKLGHVETEEMYRVFNMGIGLVLIVSAQKAQDIVTALGESQVMTIGEVKAGEKSVSVHH